MATALPLGKQLMLRFRPKAGPTGRNLNSSTCKGLKAKQGAAMGSKNSEPGLQRLGIVTSQRLISEHTVLMDPAYVHLTPRGMAATTTALATLQSHQVHSIGRYGAWTYCSIEDNLLQARALVDGPLRGVS